MKRNQPIHKTASKASPIFRRVVVVLLTLVLSLACYGVTVFAWFQADVLNAGNTIQSGSYAITVRIEDKETNTPVTAQNGGFTLEAGKGYSVTLTAEGNTSGYCEIQAGDKVLQTKPIGGTDTFTLTIYPETQAVYTFRTVWGTATAKDGISSGETIGTEPAQQESPDSPEESTTEPVEEPAEEPSTEPTKEPSTAPAEEPTTAPTQPSEPETAATEA